MAFVKTPPSLPPPFLWNRLANKTDYDVDERHNSVLLFSRSSFLSALSHSLFLILFVFFGEASTEGRLRFCLARLLRGGFSVRGGVGLNPVDKQWFVFVSC